jgi:lactobin A/cerein 7B family class IIb bacteriocin
MARIQICDLNHSDSELLYELTDKELLDINGGGWFKRIAGAVLIVGGAALAITGVGAGAGVALITGGAGIIASDKDG